MIYSWIGAVTASGFTASVKVTGPVNTRLAVSTASDMSSPSYSAATTGADGWHKLTITGLTPDTPYYWAIEEGGVLGSAEGPIRTFPTEGATKSFTVAAASCCRTGDNPNTFNRIKDRAPAFFMHMGDFHYDDITVNDPAVYQASIEGQLALSNHAPVYKEVPITYMWDDHDYGPNDSDGSATGRPAALTNYRNIVPHYPIPFSGPDDDTPISQTWVCGRVRFVQLDTRSEADFSPADPALNSLIGATQLNWLTNLIETFTEELMVIDVSVPFIIAVGEKVDTWGNATTERTAICDAIQAHAPGRVLIIHGDSHMIAMDDGTNSNFATTPSGPGPRVCCFAPLSQSNSTKGGPYSEGTYTAGETQYGVLDFFDSGTSIVVTAKGYDAVADTELVRMTWKVGDGPASDQIVYWVADVTAADALPADTAAYVRTDGANPTRVRLNGEWWSIDSIQKDGVPHTLASTQRNPIVARDEWRKATGTVTVQTGEAEARPRLRANASARGSWRFDNVSVTLDGVEQVVNGDFEAGDKTGWDQDFAQDGVVEFVDEATNPPELYVMRLDTAPGGDMDQDANRFTVADGDVLKATFWASAVGEPDDVGRLTVSFLDGTGAFLRFETFAEIGPDGTQVRAGQASMEGAGTVTAGQTTGDGTLAAQQSVLSGFAEVLESHTGSGTLVQSTLAVLSGEGTVDVPPATISGSGDLLASRATLDGTAVPTSTAQGALVASTATLMVSASVVRTGAAALQAAIAAMQGVGGLAATRTGEGSLTAQQAALEATGAVTSTTTGSGALDAGSAVLEATGQAYTAAAGALLAGDSILAGLGDVLSVDRIGAGDMQVLPAEIVAQILRTVVGSGTMSANAAIADIYPWIELHPQDSVWEDLHPQDSVWK